MLIYCLQERVHRAANNTFMVDIPLLADGLGFSQNKSFGRTKRKVRRVLKRLDKKYGLVKIIADKNDVFGITMQMQEGQQFPVPADLGSPNFIVQAPMEFKTAYIMHAYINRVYVISGGNSIVHFFDQLKGMFREHAYKAVPSLVGENK